MAFGAIDALKAAGMSCGPGKEVIIVSFDAVAAAFDRMIAGEMNVSVECNPLHGPRVAEMAKQILEGNIPPKKQFVDEGIFPAEEASEIKPTRQY
jgi:simple sugar transport system substrate-binding protein